MKDRGCGINQRLRQRSGGFILMDIKETNQNARVLVDPRLRQYGSMRGKLNN